MDPNQMYSPLTGNFGTGDNVFGARFGANEVADLMKSIDAGADLAAGGGNSSGFALRPQSLEETLANQTFLDKHVKLWKVIPKSRAFSTVEEYDRLESYGAERLNAFTMEGDLPQGDDASYSRQYSTQKYMGTLRAVSHQMGMVRSIVGDQIAKETQNGTLWLMRAVEKALFFGSSDLVSTQFDGLFKMLQDAITAGAAEPAAMIDKRSSANAGVGSSLTVDDLDGATEFAHTAPNYGSLDTVFYSTTAHRNLGTHLLGDNRAGNRLDVKNNQGGPITPGWSFSKVATMFGDLDMNPDVFLNPVAYTEAQLTAFASGDVNTRPSDPTLTSVTENGGANGGLFGTETGAYKYVVVAVNKFGNSNGTAASTGTVVTGTKSQNVLMTKGSVVPTGWVIYRTPKGVADKFYEIARVKYVAGANQTFTDINTIIAGTSVAFGIELNKNVLDFKQLAPFMRLPLGQIDLRSRWVQMLYGAPVLKSPRRLVIFTNVL